MVKTSSPETKRYILQPGEAYFMPANVPVKWHFSPGFVMTAFHFRLELMPGYNASDFLSSDFQVIRRANVPFLPPLSTTVGTARTMGDYLNIAAAIYAYAATFMDLPADKLQEMIILRREIRLHVRMDQIRFPGPAYRARDGSGHADVSGNLEPTHETGYGAITQAIHR